MNRKRRSCARSANIRSENATTLGDHVAARLRDLQERHAAVAGVRSLGLIGAFDLDGALIEGEDARAGMRITEWLMERGIVVRPYAGNTIVFGTALNVTREQLDELFEAFGAAVAANAIASGARAQRGGDAVERERLNSEPLGGNR